MNKIFLITIDTEGDNQWDNSHDTSTLNVNFVPRFQELAEKYDFKPTWLCNYEIVMNDDFVDYMRKKQNENKCEIGTHLHAWNNPPLVDLNQINNERSYLIEYPEKIMEEKIEFLTNLIFSKFGKKPVSHRSGRWAMNDKYFELLKKYGYLVDCSVTPHINWNSCLGCTGLQGSNYQQYSESYYFDKSGIREVPMTIRKIHIFQKNRIKRIKNFFGELYRFILGRYQWIRPSNDFCIDGIKKVIKKCSLNNEYIMFMIHSSELMPNGSPNFKSEKDIESLYDNIDNIFKYLKLQGYVGMTLEEFNNYLEKGE